MFQPPRASPRGILLALPLLSIISGCGDKTALTAGNSEPIIYPTIKTNADSVRTLPTPMGSVEPLPQVEPETEPLPQAEPETKPTPDIKVTVAPKVPTPVVLPTPTAAPIPKIVKFIAIGDQGTGTSEQYDVAAGIKQLCDKQKCDFGITLGDNFNPHGVEDVNDPLFNTQFEKPYGPIGIDFYPILGNHDYKFFVDGNPDAEVAYTKKSQYWKMPAKYYKYSKNNLVDFFALNTVEGYETPVAWLDTQLKNSTAKYKIVYGHHPIFSGGYYENDSRTRDLYLSTLCKYNVDLYLSGHEHSQQVLDSGCKTKLVIQGTSGEHNGVPDKTERTLWNNNQLGFLYIVATEGNLKVEVRSISNLLYKLEL